MSESKRKSTVAVDRSLLEEINIQKYEEGYNSAEEVLEEELAFLNED